MVSNMKFFLLFFIFTGVLQANVLDQLKSIGPKTDHHRIRNIDFIYMINLDQRPEKYEKSIAQLSSYRVFPYRFSAVNGWELTYEQIQDVGLKYSPSMKKGIFGTYYDKELNSHHEMISVKDRIYFCHCMARGPVGIVLSHMSIIKDAYDSGYDTIWVMEDDIQVIQDPNILSDLIEELDNVLGENSWDILFTDKDTKSNSGRYVPCLGVAARPDLSFTNKVARRSIGRKFERIQARYGAYSMIIRRRGMEKLLKFYEKYPIFLPWDMDFVYPQGIRLYCVKDDVVSTRINAESDNGSPNYLKN